MREKSALYYSNISVKHRSVGNKATRQREEGVAFKEKPSPPFQVACQVQREQPPDLAHPRVSESRAIK